MRQCGDVERLRRKFKLGDAFARFDVPNLKSEKILKLAFRPFVDESVQYSCLKSFKGYLLLVLMIAFESLHRF